MAARARVPVLDAQRLVLEEVLRHGPLTRSDIARRLRMTNARLSQVSTVLLERGLLAEADQSRVAPSSAVGRPGQPLEVVPSLSSFVGTWLGRLVTGNETYQARWLMSIVGAMILLLLYRMIAGRRGGS